MQSYFKEPVTLKVSVKRKKTPETQQFVQPQSREVDDVVQPKDCRRGQDGGVDDVEGEEKEGEAEERPGHEVAQLLVKIGTFGQDNI